MINSLKALDIDFLKRLHERVNIIPVIAKADTLSEEEKNAFKKRILEDLEFHKINVYNIESEVDDDAETKKRDSDLRVCFFRFFSFLFTSFSPLFFFDFFQAAMPFAVVGSDKEYEVNGKKVRARKYPWGLIESMNSFLILLPSPFFIFSSFLSSNQSKTRPTVISSSSGTCWSSQLKSILQNEGNIF